MPYTRENRKNSENSGKRYVILEGAIKVFTKNGFKATSMDEIADVAGVSKRTIYNHFFSKEGLFQAIVSDYVEFRNEIKHIEYSQTLPIRDQLKKFVFAELFFIVDPVRRGLARLLASTFIMDDAFRKQTFGLYQSHDDFVTWLNAAKENKMLQFDNPELTTHIFYGLVEGCLIWPALLTDGESGKNTEPVIDEIISIFLSRYGGD